MPNRSVEVPGDKSKSSNLAKVNIFHFIPVFLFHSVQGESVGARGQEPCPLSEGRHRTVCFITRRSVRDNRDGQVEQTRGRHQ